MTDLVLPAAAPIETYIDETVSVLAELLEDTPADVLAGFDFKAQGVWSFARPGAPPLKLNESLDDAGVVDGALLTLVTVSRTERYRPLVEDVIDAIAVLDESPEFDRRALNRFVGLAIPLVTLVITVMSILAWSDTGRGWWWSVALGVFGVALLIASVVSQNRYDNLDMAESLLVATLPVLAGAVALGVPLPRGVESLGAPQIAGAAAVVLLLTLATRGGPRRRAELASFLAVTATAVTGAAVAYGYGWQHWVPAGAIAFGLIIITNAAKLTVAVARIALPPIPAPGESVANEELLDPVATPDASDEETPTWQAIIASVPDSAARLSERSELAKKLLAGFLSAGALVSDDRRDCRCGAGAFLRPQHDRGRSGDGHLRVPLPAVCGSMVCLGAVGCGGRHPDGRDGEAVPVVSAKRVAGAEHFRGGRDRGADPGWGNGKRPPRVTGDEADPRTA